MKFSVHAPPGDDEAVEKAIGGESGEKETDDEEEGVNRVEHYGTFLAPFYHESGSFPPVVPGFVRNNCRNHRQIPGWFWQESNHIRVGSRIRNPDTCYLSY